MDLFPSGLPIKAEIEYQLPKYHKDGGRDKWVTDNLEKGHFDWAVYSSPEEVDPPFHLIDISQLSPEQHQALEKIYCSMWRWRENSENILSLVTIPVDDIESIKQV